jgi:hypothetical protein
MSRNYRAGLILLGLLSLVDLAGPVLTDGDNPPMAVAVTASALGALSLVSLVFAWRGSARGLVALVTAVPAFFVSDVPAAVVAGAAATIAVTIAGVLLCLRRETAPVAKVAR